MLVPAGQVRLGIIGCGGFTQHMHAPNLARNPRFKVMAACDLDIAAAERVQQITGARYVTTGVGVVLDDDAIDAVLIATRHDSHARLCIQAAAAGKHILCEKPMGLSLAECRRVADAVRAAGVVYAVGYNRGMAPLVTQARQLMAGDLSQKMIYHRIQAPFPASHWTHDPAVGGGRLVGEGCHIFDLLCELVGTPPAMVYASGGAFLAPAQTRTVDSAIVTLTFADGSVGATLIASDGCSAFPKESTEIYWAGKAIHINDFRELSYYGVVEEGEGRITLQAADKGHRRELDLFADAILLGAPPPNGVSNALRAALISFLAVESAQTGHPLPIREADYQEAK